MKKWKHLNYEQRKLINNLVSKKMKCVEIADLLGVDPSTISKELKRNRILTKKGRVDQKVCQRTQRFPYVCNSCPKKYQTCPFTQYTYRAQKVQEFADHRLTSSRVGLNMSEDEYQRLDQTIKEGVDNHQSIYHIVKSNPHLKVSVSNVYRLINEKQLSIQRMDLPYAVKYKKRKVLKAYEYKENRAIDRSGRAYIDFLAFKHQHRNAFHVQMDFLGKIKTDKKSILVLTICELHFVMLFLMDTPNGFKVVDFFNQLELQLGRQDFKRLFPSILTDRDPCFAFFDQLEASIFSDTKRTHIFYCDAFQSTQKPNVENMNKRLRPFYPKRVSIDHYDQSHVSMTSSTINEIRIASLSGASPKEAFIKVYGQKLLDKLTSIIF